MSFVSFIESAITWLLWSGLGLGALTLISFLFGWGFKFRLTGATIFTLLLSGSCWAFLVSYTPPFKVDGALYTPVVYDNGNDLVVAQASLDFPSGAIEPTLKQIAGNLKGGGRKGSNVNVRLRAIKEIDEGKSKPVILGQITRDVKQNITFDLEVNSLSLNDNNNSDLEIDSAGIDDNDFNLKRNQLND